MLNWFVKKILRLSGWYFSKQALPYWGVLLIDMFIVWGSLMFAHVLNSGTMDTINHFWELTATIGLYLLVYVGCFRVFHTYSGVMRFASFVDLMKIFFAVALASGILLMSRWFIRLDNYVWAVLHGYELLYGTMFATMGMWIVRVVIKTLYDAGSQSVQAPYAMIFGTQEGGIALAKSIRSLNPQPYRIQGFITNIPAMASHQLLGYKVIMYNDDTLLKYMLESRVKYIVVSPLVQEFMREECQKLIDEWSAAGIKILMMNNAQEWDGKTDLSVSQLREVEVEDLLPRDKIEVDMGTIGAQLNDSTILITGAAGSIGSEMVRQIAQFAPKEMVLVDQAETPMHDVRLWMASRYPDVKAETIVTSITNQSRMEQLFAKHKPQYVFHAAAYKHVPMMEDNPSEAVQNNIYGTRVIADLAVKYGTKKFVMISTDKAVNPTNVMGCSKRICEIYCQALNAKLWKQTQETGVRTTQFITTRFGNVLGSNGSVIPIFKEQIRKGGPVTVTHPDIIRFFMLIPEACKLVLEAGTMGKGGEIFVFDMGKPVRIADLAQRMIEMSGAKDVKIEFSGLRDGEKLYEEVLSESEKTKPTFHKKIRIAQVREYAYEDIRTQEEELYDLAATYDDMAIVKKMKEIVPEFKSQHSKYEALDK